MDDNAIDIVALEKWVREAGQIALSYFNHGVKVHRKADRSLVTEADEEIEALLTARLRETYPEHAIIGEEGAREGRGQYLWAIDPLDGTRAFIHGLPIWGVSIGLLKEGKPILGVFYMPYLDEYYYTGVHGEAFLNDRPLHCPLIEDWDRNTAICVPSNVHRKYIVEFQGIIRSLGSLAAHITYVARGSIVGALLGRPRIWDLAGALAVLERAGGEIRYLSGHKVDLRLLLDGSRSPEPVVVAHPALMERVRSLFKIK